MANSKLQPWAELFEDPDLLNFRDVVAGPFRGFFFLPFSFPFSLPFYSPYLLLFISFLSAVKSLVLIVDKARKWGHNPF